MAYGKIKADSLVHDNGGSDVEVTISSLAAKAGTVSPNFTGTPTAPTATAGTNTTQLATTAFVATANQAKADLVSPQFSGTPQAPNAAVGTNSTQIATTNFVQSEGFAKTDVEQLYTAGQRGEITELAAGTSFTLDLDASNNFLIQPNGTYTVALSNVSGAKGQCGSIFIKPTAAAASGSFPTTMKFVGGAAGITLTGTSGSIDRIDYIVQDDSSGYECLTCNFTANYVS